MSKTDRSWEREREKVKKPFSQTKQEADDEILNTLEIPHHKSNQNQGS